MNDIELVLFSVPQETAEAVGGLLTEEGNGYELRDAETSPSLAEGMNELLVWMPASDVQRRVDLVETLLKSLEDMGLATKPWSWRTEKVDPDSWKDAYKRYFNNLRLGKRFVIKPSWRTYDPKPEDYVIEIDPSMAFGTGLHASTALMIHGLERIARLGPPPQSVLDLGCGTGILAIAAAKLWPHAYIVAVDNDESAIQVCKENVQRNNLDGKIIVEQRSASEIKRTFDLVLANLSFETLKPLKPKMRGYLDDYGRVILSGLLADQAQKICQLYCRDLSLEPEYTEEIDGWMALSLRARE